MTDFLNTFHFASDGWTLLTPCIMIALDFITGLVYAWASRTFQSKKMRTGLSKKVGELAIIVIGEVLSFALGLPKYIMAGVAFYIILMELMSIFENLDKMGVRIPKFIKNVVNNAADSLNNDDIIVLNDKAGQLKDDIEELKGEDKDK